MKSALVFQSAVQCTVCARRISRCRAATLILFGHDGKMVRRQMVESVQKPFEWVLLTDQCLLLNPFTNHYQRGLVPFCVSTLYTKFENDSYGGRNGPLLKFYALIKVAYPPISTPWNTWNNAISGSSISVQYMSISAISV